MKAGLGEPAGGGVSVVICCHNSAQRLPAALAHLKAQKDCNSIPWEVIVIDNASTDDSAAVARRCWPNGFPIPLRIVHESNLGLSNARAKGLNESRHQLVSFVDDDNWVSPSWVATVSAAMSPNAHLGAIAGVVLPAFESSPPAWFERFKGWYAIHTEDDAKWYGDSPFVLTGAGLTVRKEAWQQLVANGFFFRLSDRRGADLSAGGDSELTLALRMAGWQLRFEPRLLMRHFLPSSRLKWRYLRKAVRGYSRSAVPLDAYFFANQRQSSSVKDYLRLRWFWHAGATVQHLLKMPLKTLRATLSPLEGCEDALLVEEVLGRLQGLLAARRDYTRLRVELQNAAWCRSCAPASLGRASSVQPKQS